jgi:hypothetical protein
VSTTREQIMVALQTLVTGAYSWATPPRRRLKLWGDVPLAERPCCFIFEGGRDSYNWTSLNESKNEINVELIVYINAKDPNVIGATLVNNILDAIDTAVTPEGGFPGAPGGANTLGGLAQSCRIYGEVFKDPGDLDGDGFLQIPIKIITS